MDKRKGKQSRPVTAGKFTRAGALARKRIRGTAARRGFSESRILTDWAEICGAEIATLALPLKIGFGSAGGLGATLTVACVGARAAEVQMLSATIRERVNACYGYNAVARVRIAQQDAAGFAEAQAAFAPPAAPKPPEDRADLRQKAAEHASVIGDPGLRLALEQLGYNVLRKSEKAASRRS
ncbi:MAG: DUF721 domain-containing protein [Pseudomonadota bacterium]